MISLYINDSHVDLGAQSLILYNYTMEELNNPSVVKNSYTQQVTLPGTANNDAIFACNFRVDSETQTTGFNPLVKTPFKIYDETNRILERGYIKLDKVTRNGEKHEYGVTLYGGLGGFFYNLMYQADGSKRTLADMQWWNDYDERVVDPSDLRFGLYAADVNHAWKVLAGTITDGIYNMFNFAPAYNGIPSNGFDANKALYKPGFGTNIMPNLYTSVNVTEGSTTGTFTARDDANDYILVEMENKHDEWQMQDLRGYLQRPVFSIKAFLESIMLAGNSGGYTFVVDDSILTANNPFVASGWVTLPLIDMTQNEIANVTLSDILAGTDSPADYLISFAKVFGYLFVCDPAENTITMLSRNAAWADAERIDMTKRIAKDKTIVPLPMDSKFFNWKYTTAFGAFAKEYANKYGRQYAEKVVNTGYEFNADTKDVENIVFNGAADVIQADAMYQVFGGNADPDIGSFVNYLFKVPFFEEVSWRLYKKVSGKNVEHKCNVVEGRAIAPFRYSGNTTYNDFMPKVQLCGDDGKPEDGSNVLLFFNGMVDTPANVQSGYSIQEANFYLTDDIQEMALLNGGKACWNISRANGDGVLVSALPQFTRYYETEETACSMEFGVPREVATPSAFASYTTIYNNFWKDYISDRYQVDTKVMTAKVDLSGMDVNERSLLKFYWYGGAWWVMNAIHDHHIGGDELTECEFVRVHNTSNYEYGQVDWNVEDDE